MGAAQDVDLDVEVELAHALQDRLARLLIDSRSGTTGSSATILLIAMPSFSALALSLGVTETEITGAGKTIGSRVAGLSSSHSVWPVCTFLRPTSATMSPACAVVDQRAVIGVHLDHAADALASCP